MLRFEDLAGIRHDVPYAWRILRRTPGFTAAAVLSLVLGIATSTTVFSLVDAALFRPLPFEAADRLMLLNITQQTPAEGEVRHRWSWRRFQLLERSLRSFETIASSSNNVVTLTGTDSPQPVQIEIVSPRYMQLMRVPFALGRGFDLNSAAPEVILGFDLWQRQYGGSPDVVGRGLSLNGVALTVVGVVGRGFAGVSGLAQAWIPAAMAPAVTYNEYLTTNQNFITVVGRLQPGVTPEAARAEIATVGERIQLEEPSEADTPQDRFGATLTPLATARIDVITRRALLLVAGGSAVLLLIACANVTSLLLGRAVTRRREIAVRLAVGASRARLIRQLLVESAVFTAIAAVPSLLVAVWMSAVVRMPVTLARRGNFWGAIGEFSIPEIDARVLGFVVAVCACTVFIVGLVPAIRATRRDLTVDLRSGARETGGKLGLRDAVVALQIAAAIVLLTGSGLLLTSYVRLREAPLGFDGSRLLTFMIRPSEVQYPPPAASVLVDRMLDEIGRVPGVEAATVDGCTPLTVQCARGTLQIVGQPRLSPADAPNVRRHYVAPAHFETLRVPIVAGRGITASDRSGAPLVVVVNEAAVRRFWPNQDPIGRRIWFEGAPVAGSPDASAEIIGVVGNVAYAPLDETPIEPDFFTPYAQFTYASRMVIVRTREAPELLVPPIAQAVRRANPDLALFDVQSMETRAGLSWAKQTAQASLFFVITVIALGLAVAGVYGVTVFVVASRAREIGVRMALGSPTLAIVTTSIARTARLGLVGLTLGLVGALWLSGVLRASLYNTNPLTGWVYVGAVTVLVAALLLGTYVPVRRALRVNPFEVLRAE
jgi:predicted permease